MPVVRRLTFKLLPVLLASLLASSATGVSAGEVEPTTIDKTVDATPDAVKAELPALVAAENIVKDAETGIASWYGNTFHRQRTASGETFDANALTAAHPTLPFGTWVQVTLLSTGRSVVVRITDRGPHIANRLIDISRAAAAKIGLVQRGAGEVVIEPVSQPPKIR